MYLPVVLEAFAECFDQLLLQVLVNSGVGFMQALDTLSVTAAGFTTVTASSAPHPPPLLAAASGGGAAAGCGGGAAATGAAPAVAVYDDRRGREEALSRAVDLVTLLLRCDRVVVNTPTTLS